MATTLAAALAVCSIIVVRVAGAFIPFRTLARVLASLAVTVAIGTQIPALSRALAPVLAASLAGVFVVGLVVSGELQGDDLRWLRSALRRR
jgi:hypothetical protein